MEHIQRRMMTVALAGNPNVGKSTVFNALTGMKQHTGNWAGKTVEVAEGIVETDDCVIRLVDIPGTYSLIAHSAEEEVAAEAICFDGADGVIVVCDGGCLERNLNLVLQILEVTGNVIVCVNLMDEAEKAGISIDEEALSEMLGCPVVMMAARQKKGLAKLKRTISSLMNDRQPLKIEYDEDTEREAAGLYSLMPEGINKRWATLRMIDGGEHIRNKILSLSNEAETIIKGAHEAREKCRPETAGLLFDMAKSIAERCVKRTKERSSLRLKADKLLTGKYTGLPLMVIMLGLLFYITVSVANYPSGWLSAGLFYIGDKLKWLMEAISCPPWLTGMIIDGVYKVLAWVVSVMLPPMAIFFPLFTLLEDAGYLPRVAFNMDSAFKRCSACGKQSLTMAMGLGCNAVGVTGCRIIDSPRERYIAIITNSMMPCNGRFPSMIMLISLFIVAGSGVLSALTLTGILVIGVGATFLASWLLSKTILKGQPSSFTLELPPFRRPKFGEVIIRSMLDRTLFVLKRAVIVAAPAGLVMWLMANISIGDIPVLSHICGALDPVGRFIGLDGEILTAFILGLPANEIVLPIAIMAYTSAGTIAETSAAEISNILIHNGWTQVTAICTVIFSLLHWPCSTTLMTIKKETGSILYTLLSAVIPTVIGVVLCLIIRLAAG